MPEFLFWTDQMKVWYIIDSSLLFLLTPFVFILYHHITVTTTMCVNNKMLHDSLHRNAVGLAWNRNQCFVVFVGQTLRHRDDLGFDAWQHFLEPYQRGVTIEALVTVPRNCSYQMAPELWWQISQVLRCGQGFKGMVAVAFREILPWDLQRSATTARDESTR